MSSLLCKRGPLINYLYVQNKTKNSGLVAVMKNKIDLYYLFYS